MQTGIDDFKKRAAGELFLYEPEGCHIENITGDELRGAYEFCGHEFDGKKIVRYLQEERKKQQMKLQREMEAYRQLEDLMAGFPEKQIYFTICKKDSLYGQMQRPYRVRGSIAFLYNVLLDESKTGIKTCAVTESMCRMWNITEEELYLAGMTAMALKFPYRILKKQALSGEYYVAASRCFGLSTLFYEESPLKQIAEKAGKDLWVAPLSIHEAAIFEEGSVTEELLGQLLSEGQYFADSPWYYSRSMRQIAVNSRERKQLELMKKTGIPDAEERWKG